jgi:hypothetical protein
MNVIFKDLNGGNRSLYKCTIKVLAWISDENQGSKRGRLDGDMSAERTSRSSGLQSCFILGGPS